MDQSLLNMDRFTVQKGGSAWQEQIGNFADRLNPSRIAAGYDPLPYKVIARLLKRAGVSNAEDAYLLFKRCESYDNFSKGFYHQIKSGC